MKKILRKRFLLQTFSLLASFLLLSIAHAQKVASVSGAWSSNATWGNSAPPTAGQTVTINGNVNVIVDVENAVAASIQLNPGSQNNTIATLTFGSSTSKLTVGGPVNIGENGNRRGSIIMTNGGTLIANSIDAGAVNTWTPGTGTIELRATNTLVTGSVDNVAKINVFNNLTINGGTTTLIQPITINGNLTLTAGTLDVSTHSLSIRRNLVNNGGTINPRSGTITLSGSGLQTISGSLTSLTNFHNLIVSNAAGVAINSNVSASGIVNLISGNVTVASVPTTLNLLAGSSVNVPANRTFTINGVLDARATTTGTVSGDGSFALNADARLVTSNEGGVGGFITTNNKSFNAAALYQFEGATATPFPSQISTAKELIVAANLSLNKDFVVSGLLTLSADILTIPAGRVLTISSGEAVFGANFSSAKHINIVVNSSTDKGIIRLTNQGGSALIPIGTGGYYLPVTVATDPTLGRTNAFDISVFRPITVTGTTDGREFNVNEKKQVVDAVWIVQRTAGPSRVDINLGWPESLEGEALELTADQDLGITMHDGTKWLPAEGTGDQATNTASRFDILTSQFAPPYAFSVAKRFAEIALPVKFAHVKATRKGAGVDVSFANLTEEEVAVYHVERSTNGYQFQTFGTLAPKANNNARVDYLHTDAAPVAGDNYYRIRAVETSGKQVYSSVVKVGINGAAASLVLYPNPASKASGINLQLANLPAGVYSIRLFNGNGQVVATKQLQHTGGSLSEALPLQGTGAGRYIVEVKGAVQFTQSFLLQ
jgi:hypothetical protein